MKRLQLRLRRAVQKTCKLVLPYVTVPDQRVLERGAIETNEIDGDERLFLLDVVCDFVVTIDISIESRKSWLQLGITTNEGVLVDFPNFLVRVPSTEILEGFTFCIIDTCLKITDDLLELFFFNNRFVDVTLFDISFAILEFERFKVLNDGNDTVRNLIIN